MIGEDDRGAPPEAATHEPAAEDIPASRRRPARTESDAERLDRNFGEILQELRVAQTGVQILFAFLLTLAFTQRFTQLTDFQRGVYIATLMLCAAATGLLIAPVAFHRLMFRRGLKARVVTAANRFALGGLVLLLLALIGAVLLITDFVLGDLRAGLLTAAAGAWLLVFWFLLPALSRGRRDE